jgi:hypothetical protein
MSIFILWVRILVDDERRGIIEKEEKQAHDKTCCKGEYFYMMKHLTSYRVYNNFA